MKNIIIDTNVFIYIFEIFEENFFSQTCIDSFHNFFKNGKEFNLIISSSKMFKELGGWNDSNESSSFNDDSSQKITDFIEILNYFIKYENSIQIQLTLENEKIDEEIRQFVHTGLWNGNKDKDPILERIKGDPHIIYLAHKFDVKVLLSCDTDLIKKMKNDFDILFGLALKPNPLLFCKCDLFQDNFDISKELGL